MTRDVPPEELRLASIAGRKAVYEGADYLHVRPLADGRAVFLVPLGAGLLQLAIGVGTGVYLDSWYFEPGDWQRAWRAALGWDGDGEPEGWYRHPASGRRRPGGDPAKEFIRP